jgi:hypothetical protein
MFWYLKDYTNQKCFAQWALNAKTVQLWLLPVQFTFPTHDIMKQLSESLKLLPCP